MRKCTGHRAALSIRSRRSSRVTEVHGSRAFPTALVSPGLSGAEGQIWARGKPLPRPHRLDLTCSPSATANVGHQRVALPGLSPRSPAESTPGCHLHPEERCTQASCYYAPGQEKNKTNKPNKAHHEKLCILGFSLLNPKLKTLFSSLWAACRCRNSEALGRMPHMDAGCMAPAGGTSPPSEP